MTKEMSGLPVAGLLNLHEGEVHSPEIIKDCLDVNDTAWIRHKFNAGAKKECVVPEGDM